MFEILIVMACVIGIIIYLLAKRHYNFWRKQDIAGPMPVLLFGNIKDCFFGRKAMWEVFSEIYRSFHGHPFVGIFRAITPCILIRDPALIRDIQISNFKCFSHNGFQIDIKNEPILGRNAFFLKDSQWKITRNLFTRSFTSEMMKSVFYVFDEAGKELIHYIKIHVNHDIGTDAKDLCGKFTAHNVACWAFGLNSTSMKESDSEFRKLAREFLSSDHIPGFIQLLAVIAPSMLRFFSVKIVPKYIENKMTEIIKNSSRYRREHHIYKNDFFQYLMAQNINDHFSEEELTAHAASFLIDGYETSSIVMSFILFELAANQEIQDKLRKELKEILRDTEEISLEALFQMNYLDACINETLRKHAVLAFNIKECTKRYTFNTEYGKTLTIEPGQLVILPIDAIQNDSNYFDEPEKFIPERMLNSSVKNNVAFMPFGVGPRACIGKQYGIMQLKVGIAHMFLHYKITLNARTKLPIKYDPWLFVKYPKGGIWLDFKLI